MQATAGILLTINRKRCACAGPNAMGIYDASAYDGVFYVGGFGTMWDFPESPVNNIYILQDFSSNLIFSHS